MKYHKIQSIFKRDQKGRFTSEFSLPEFAYLYYNHWVFDEKVDGTNVQVHWTGSQVYFGGRNDGPQEVRPSLPIFLYDKLVDIFKPSIFNDLPPLTLYGEGYGHRIQKGGDDYIKDDVSFILFDVFIEKWQTRENVINIANKLGLNVVPYVGSGTLEEAVHLCKDGFESQLRSTPPEGIVIRPLVELQDRHGKRIITKLKLKDFN